MVNQRSLIKHGWMRATLYILLVYAILNILSLLVANVITGIIGTGKDLLVQPFIVMYSVLGIVIFAFTFGMRRIVDRETFKSLGFPFKSFSGDAWIGFFTATSMLSIGSLILIVAGFLSFTDVQFDANAIIIQLVFLVVVAFVEELIFRGYFLNNMLQSVNRWIALAVSAALFAVFHITNPDVTVLAIVNVFLAGMLIGINYIYTRNLWFGIFFHFAWNFMQGAILGFDVSGTGFKGLFIQNISGNELFTGGKFGFEGSLICTLLLIITTAIWAILFSKKYNAEPGKALA